MNQRVTINAVAILPAQGDRFRLTEIFRRSRWHLDLSECLMDARVLLAKVNIGVVVTDCHLPDGEWKDVLHELERRHTTPPPVIVSSRLADERLWTEVLNLCGYDVLATPFHANEVFSSISSAWRNWREQLGALGPQVGITQTHSGGASLASAGENLDSIHSRQGAHSGT